MTKPIQISASILAADFAHLAEAIKKSEEAGVDRFHIDVMDGHFVPNLTIGPVIIEAVRKHTKLPLEVHLMIEHPWDYIEAYAKAGADIIQIQVECYGERTSSSQQYNQYPKVVTHVFAAKLRSDLKKIKALGKKAHIVINPDTPLMTEVLDECDGVLIMSVNPGFAGQKFMPNVLTKVEQLARTFKGDIAIDGGVNGETAPACVKAGAGVLITASYLYGSKDPKAVVKGLKSLRSTTGQSALEYMLLFSIVAAVVLFSFKHLLPDVKDRSEGYFNSVSNVIMGATPEPIPGRPCDDCNGHYKTCNCPAPAFGGEACKPADLKCD